VRFVFLGVISNALFFSPILYYILKLQNKESGKAEFINFASEFEVFWIHSAAVTIAFIAFSLAALNVFQKRARKAEVAALLMSSIPIALYLAGYGRIFTLLMAIVF
jgi:hypothetical protein